MLMMSNDGLRNLMKRDILTKTEDYHNELLDISNKYRNKEFEQEIFKLIREDASIIEEKINSLYLNTLTWQNCRECYQDIGTTLATNLVAFRLRHEIDGQSTIERTIDAELERLIRDVSNYIQPSAIVRPPNDYSYLLYMNELSAWERVLGTNYTTTYREWLFKQEIHKLKDNEVLTKLTDRMHEDMSEYYGRTFRHVSHFDKGLTRLHGAIYRFLEMNSDVIYELINQFRKEND